MVVTSPDLEGKRLPAWLRLSLDHLAFLSVLLDVVLTAAFSLYAAGVAFSFGLGWAFLIVFISLLAMFLILPKAPSTRVEDKLAVLLSKPMAFFLKRTEGAITAIEKIIGRVKNKFARVEPMDKKAIKTFLQQQRDIVPEELKADLKQAISGLEVNSGRIKHFMIAKKKAKFVSADEQVGPILLSELHDTSRRIFPVKDDSEIVGTVRLDSLTMLKSGGKVSEVLDSQIIMAEKNDPITAIVQKFVDSGTELVFIKNETNGIEAVVYLEDVLAGLV